MDVNPQSATQRALDRASALGGSARVTWASNGWRRVRGSTGRKYWVQMVTPDWRSWTCQCRAAQFGNIACSHRAMVFLEQLRDSSRGSKIEREN